MDTPSARLIAGLHRPESYPHDVQNVTVRETHISWVLLTGEWAYKVKKPVKLDFLDFSTLELRAHFCAEEVRLNRRFAPQIYLDCLPISGSCDHPRVGGDGPPLEYAVRMRQFPEAMLFDRLLASGDLTTQHVDELARELSAFHAQAAVMPADGRFATLAEIHQEAIDNLAALEQSLARTATPQFQRLADDVAALHAWTQVRFESLRHVFDHRRQHGFIRECHGDLHLGNIVLWNDRPTLFDGVEFNEEFRWIDVINDAAFATMDLDDRGRADLSHRFVNAYLEATGDYGGLQVLPWYVAYRALVRAKVATIRAGQQGVPPVESAGYLTFARRTTRRPSPMVVITTGPSGSGKTTGTQPLVDQLGAVRLRSDIERKRLFGLKPTDSSGSGVDDGLYTRDATAKTYDRLAELAAEVLNSGYTPVVDATFLQRGQRRQFGRLADDLRVPFVILPFGADASLLRERVTHRALAEDDASEATPAVLEHQLATQEPLDEDERPYCRTVDELLGRESSR